MMVQWCHAENAFAGELERGHLQDHRKGFDNKNATHNRQHHFLTNNDRDHAECRTQSQGPYITHKDHGGIGVKPEKSEARTTECAGKNK